MANNKTTVDAKKAAEGVLMHVEFKNVRFVIVRLKVVRLLLALANWVWPGGISVSIKSKGGDENAETEKE